MPIRFAGRIDGAFRSLRIINDLFVAHALTKSLLFTQISIADFAGRHRDEISGLLT